MYDSSYMFRHYIAISGSVSSAFWEMLIWGAVDRMLWMGINRHNTPIHNILSTASQFSIAQKALGTLPEDGYVMPKHAAAIIYN
jgi:hypothetical protein